MNLTNYYWYFQSAIPPRICDDIVKYGKQLQDQMAVTGGYGGKKLNKKVVNLQNILKTNTMIGIVIVGINHTINLIHHHMVK